MVKTDPSISMKMHLYQLVGRAAPSAKNPKPKIFRMKMFARNSVVAKSKFWYYMKRITKAKLTGGEMLGITECFEKHPTTVNNYGIWLRYDSRSGTHNMYKEYRDTTLTGAVGQMYQEMAGRHRALASNVQIIKTATLKNDECRRSHITQFHSGAKFPVPRRIPRTSLKYKKTFRAGNRPSVFAQ
ncbi:60S ribosomal protein L18A [Perkinsus olseni]|uniref:60S ribosomal protein L18a n=2 Tax=Perkinsus olseni TaxID=32597 RepID=A0A7J6M6Z4_PEROL|nr:60S ribosomal protein L18A [Perkinsus olseni]KAF4670374.1 60S ribosomal protein L18A [Perkinsus olseni]